MTAGHSFMGVVDALGGGRKEGNSYRCQCPVHGGKALIVSEGDQGRVLWHCKTNCDQEAVTDAIMELMGASPNSAPPPATAKAATKPGRKAATHQVTYLYPASDGHLYEKGRFINQDGSKTFRWRRAGDTGPSGRAWPGLGKWDVGERDMPLYGADALPVPADPNVIVYLVEGEKCVEAMQRAGHDAVSLCGGASQQAYGEGLGVLAGRYVRLWPDNDEPGLALMSGLAEALDGVAAKVELIVATGGPGDDAADYLVTGASLGDLDISRDPTAPEITTSRDGYHLTFPWPGGTVELRYSDLQQTHRSLDVLLQAEVLAPGVSSQRYFTRLNLASSSARQGIARELKELFSEPGGQRGFWTGTLVRAAGMVREAYIEDDPAIGIMDAELLPTGYVVGRVIVQDNPTVWFGDGGSGKSMLALYAAICVMEGLPWLGQGGRPRPGRVLMLDYETDAGTVRQRLSRLADGLGQDVDLRQFVYWPAGGIPLMSVVDGLRRRVARDDIDLLIVDSAAAACGGTANDDDLATRFFNGLDQLGEVSTLIVAHIAKAKEDKSKPFGSAVWSNRPRSTWYIEREQDMGASVVDIGMFHKKVNDGKLELPQGVQMAFDDSVELGPIRISRSGLADTVHLQAELPLRDRLVDALKTAPSHQLKVSQMAERLDVKADTIRRTLRRHSRVFKRLENGYWGLYGEQPAQGGF